MGQISENIRVSAKKPVNIVRALATLTGRTAIFNDRRKNGGRSIKVWGWNLEQYKAAVYILKQHGFNAELKYYMNIPHQMRIHTTPENRFYKFPGGTTVLVEQV